MTHPHEVDSIQADRPVRVQGLMHLEGVAATRPESAEFGAMFNWALTGAEKPFRLLPRDPKRARAVITSGSAPPAETLTSTGYVVAPVVGAAIATIAAPPAGLYKVDLSAFFDATVVAGTDRNNIGLYRAGTLIYTLPIAGAAAAASYDPTDASLVVRLNGSQNLTLQAIVNASAAAGYSAGLSATLITPTQGVVWIGKQTQVQATNPLGFALPTGQSVELRSQEEVWIVPDGTNPANVSVLVEQWDRN